MLQLWMTCPKELAAYVVSDDGSDGCSIGFVSREHAVDARGCLLDGVVVRLFKVNTQEHPNRHFCALYHHNLGYAVAEIVNEMG